MRINRIIKKVRKAIVLFGAIGIPCVIASQDPTQVLTVDDDKKECPHAEFQTIQEAINAAANGGEIKICSGTYPEQIVISKALKIVADKGASLIPAGVKPNAKDLAMDEDIAVFALVQNTKDVTIEGLLIDGTQSGINGCEMGKVGVAFVDASGSIKGTEIKNFGVSEKQSTFCEYNYGIFIQSSDEGVAEVSVEENKILGLGNKSIVGANMGTIVRAKENMIVGMEKGDDESKYGVFLDFGASGTIQGNKFAIME